MCSDQLLPSSMIQEMNLLPQIFDPSQKLTLTSFVNQLIQEGGYLLMIRVAMLIMYRKLDMAEKFRLLRYLMEKLYLFKKHMASEKQITLGLRENYTTVKPIWIIGLHE